MTTDLKIPVALIIFWHIDYQMRPATLYKRYLNYSINCILFMEFHMSFDRLSNTELMNGGGEVKSVNTFTCKILTVTSYELLTKATIACTL